MRQYLDRGSIWAITLLFFLLIEGILTQVSWQVYEVKKTYILERNSEIFANVHHATRISYEKLTKLLYDEVINKPDIIAIFKRAGDADPEIQNEARRELYERLLPTYERLKALNLKQLHFHLPDMTSFLRFHKPEKYGDSLKGIRYSLELVNREKRYVEGFEEGRVYNGFRHVYPLFDETGMYIGSVETSLSFEALKSDIEATTGNHVDFVVKRSIVEKKVWKSEQEHYYPSPISRDYLHEKFGFDEKLQHVEHDAITHKIAEKAALLMEKNQRFALYNDGFVIVFLPINNVQGEAGAAYLVSYTQTNAVDKIFDSALVLWCFSTMGVLLTSLLLYLLLRKMAQISYLATFDNLTGLMNRGSMISRLDEEVARTDRSHDPFSIIYLDIDNFKSINDRFGHKSGDRVLEEVARILQDNMRRTDAVGRWGGEEFLVCLPHTGRDEATVVAEKLRLATASHDFDIDGSVTCSFGTAHYEEGEAIDKTIGRADEALYRAKSEGRNRVVTA